MSRNRHSKPNKSGSRASGKFSAGKPRSGKPGSKGPSFGHGTGGRPGSGPQRPGSSPQRPGGRPPFRKTGALRPGSRPQGPRPSPEAMDILLKRSGITLEPAAIERLWAYHNLLRNHNDDRDLTRITGFEPMVIKHYADCLWVSKLTDLPSPIVDVGTGAGFPGIPLKIANPDVHFILAEPRPRRVQFLRMVVDKLKLQPAEVFEHKVSSRSFQTPVKGVITRALETLDKTFLRTSGATQPGTKLIFMKGPNADEEMRDVQRRFGEYFRLVQDEKYTIPHTPHQRRLLVYERTAESFLSDETAPEEIPEHED